MKTTDELIKILKSAKSANDFVESNYEDISNITFIEYLYQCMGSRNLNRSQVIDNANIQKNYGYQIFDGSKKPSRNKVLALCFAMSLSLDEANRLLKLADHAVLYPRIKRDSIIMFALEQRASLIDANILLHEMEEQIIE